MRSVYPTLIRVQENNGGTISFQIRMFTASRPLKHSIKTIHYRIPEYYQFMSESLKLIILHYLSYIYIIQAVCFLCAPNLLKSIGQTTEDSRFNFVFQRREYRQPDQYNKDYILQPEFLLIKAQCAYIKNKWYPFGHSYILIFCAIP